MIKQEVRVPPLCSLRFWLFSNRKCIPSLMDYFSSLYYGLYFGPGRPSEEQTSFATWHMYLRHGGSQLLMPPRGDASDQPHMHVRKTRVHNGTRSAKAVILFFLCFVGRQASQPASQPANSRKYDLKEIIGIYGSHRPQSTNAGRGWPKEILKRPE